MIALSAASAVSAGCIFFAFYPDLDNVAGSANPGGNRQGTRRTVLNTGPAFHAAVKINDSGFALVHFQHMVGTDLGAQAAADTLVLIQYKGGYRF